MRGSPAEYDAVRLSLARGAVVRGSVWGGIRGCVIAAGAYGSCFAQCPARLLDPSDLFAVELSRSRSTAAHLDQRRPSRDSATAAKESLPADQPSNPSPISTTPSHHGWGMVGGVLSIVRLTGARVAYLERQELDEHGLRLPEPGQQLGLELEAYLGEGERVVGRWQGAGAEALGLGEVVREGQLAALLGGVNPVSGELLGRRFTQRERLVAVTDPASGERVLIRQALDPVGGWDLVFAAPKSVSLAYALGSEDVRAEVLAAHEAAVTAALGMLERHAAYTRRGRNGVILEPAAGVVVARFDHELARRVEHADGSTTTDPHLHTHCALLGKALSGDGQWRALRHPLIIGEWQKPLGAAYRAHLRSEISERLGWAWEGLDARGLSELCGWGSGVLAEMSQRRRQVEARLVEAWGTSEGLNGRQTRSAAVETRALKSPAGCARGAASRLACAARRARLGARRAGCAGRAGRVPGSGAELFA